MADDLVHDSDLGDVIEIAAERQQQADESLSVEEVKEVAEELDIDASHIDDAVNELEVRKRADLQEKAETSKFKLIGGGVVGAFVLILIGIGISMSGSLSSKYTDVEQAKAQYQNVLDRKKSVEKMWKGKPDSPDKMAALEGAENRVRVEGQRYDAATKYNQSLGFWATMTGAEDKVPLSSELGK